MKEESGQALLWVVETNGGFNPSMRALALKDATQVELMRISYGIGTQVKFWENSNSRSNGEGINVNMTFALLCQAAGLQGLGGQMIGNVMISAKAVKDHKKDHKDHKDKDGKRQVVLTDPMGQVLLSMSGKSKHGGGNMEMKIKGSHTTTSTAGLPLLPSDKKHKDKKDHKDKDKKDHKDKDKKDKDKKNKKSELGELSGNLITGFRVRLSQSNASLQERTNIVGLLVAYVSSINTILIDLILNPSKR